MYGKIISKAKHYELYGQAKTLVLMVIALLAYGAIGFAYLKRVGLVDGLILAIESLEFSHTPEPTSFLRLFQVSLFLFGGILVSFSVWNFFELVFKGHVGKYIHEVVHLVKASRSKNHVVICGGGRVGHTLAKMLKEKRQKIVIIEKDSDTAAHLRKQGFTVINGDALNEETLREANIESANTLIAAISSGEKNVLLTLAAKQINPKISVIARSDDESQIKKLKSVGAKQVILPEIAAAKEFISLMK